MPDTGHPDAAQFIEPSLSAIIDTDTPDTQLQRITTILVATGIEREVVAEKLNARGKKLRNASFFRRAATAFELSHTTDLKYVPPIYNRACVAALQKDFMLAVAWLTKLQKLRTRKARRQLRKVAKDSDFDGIRDTEEFKQFTRGMGTSTR